MSIKIIQLRKSNNGRYYVVYDDYIDENTVETNVCKSTDDEIATHINSSINDIPVLKDKIIYFLENTSPSVTKVDICGYIRRDDIAVEIRPLQEIPDFDIINTLSG